MNSSSFKPPETGRALRAGILSGLLGLLLVVLVTVAVGRAHIDVADLQAIGKRTRVDLMLASMGIMSLAFLFLGMRWRTLFPLENRPSGVGLSAILCAGLLLNSALPGPVGELGSAWFAHRRYRVSLGMSLASGMGARIIGMIVAALAALVCFVWANPPVPDSYRTGFEITAGLIGCMGIGLLVVIVRPHWLSAVSALTLGRVAAFRKLDETVLEASTALATLREQGMMAFVRCVLWSLVAHSTVLTGIFVAAWSLGAEPDPAGLLFTYATTTAAVIVMFALPGSQVGWDALFLALLTTTAEVSMSDALAMAIVVRIQQLCIMGLGAATLTWLARTVPVDEE